MSKEDLEIENSFLSGPGACLIEVIEDSARLLPKQGPITSFAFLNPLEGLESHPFSEGLQLGAKLNGCEPYLPESRYREWLNSGRIDVLDLEASLRSQLGSHADELVVANCSRLQLRMTLLKSAFPTGQLVELQWVMSESDALRKCRSELEEDGLKLWLEVVRSWVSDTKCEGQVPLASRLVEFGVSDVEKVPNWREGRLKSLGLRLLWEVCLHGATTGQLPSDRELTLVRYRDAVKILTQIDSDILVLEVLGPFCAAFTDQGLAQWKLPGRDRGFLERFAALHDECYPTRWNRNSVIGEALRRVQQRRVSAVELIEESLVAMGVSDSERKGFIEASLLAFRGWAGMIWQMEDRADRFPHPVQKGTLVEFLAVQLLLERWAIEEALRNGISNHQFCGLPESSVVDSDGRVNWAQLKRLSRGVDRRSWQAEHWAFRVFQLVQVLKIDIATLASFGQEEWNRLFQEVSEFPSHERRRLFHAAYEHHYRIQALKTISSFCKRRAARVDLPKFQAIFCIDAREESFRRHVEEIEPHAETFSNAGFFNVPIYYRGVGDAHYTALCPVIVKPQYWVTEEVVLSVEDAHRRRAVARRFLGGLSRNVHHGSRELASGAVLSASLGVLASFPLVLRILFPHLSAVLRRAGDRFLAPPPNTRLRLERSTETPGPEGGGIGLNLQEMVAIGERALRDTGLTHGFARIVLVLGHGSSCLNNPHKSLYDCGACTGNAGGPNARALAYLLNDRRVRAELANRGIVIPHETSFLGGLHNTGCDTITYYDIDLLPVGLSELFREVRHILIRACEQNAHERSRRFFSIPLDVTPKEALRRVDDRTEDLAQTRPEYGNCTNAMCFVGRRSRIRGLFLDRRSFMMSYDHDQDNDDGLILGRILAAVVPVCSGINLQYTLSAMDSVGWGAGTKLPHNITSLLGVMDGAASDLRCGLPWQGTDIHEPMRLLFVIETTPDRLRQVMGRFPVVDRILRNEWSQLALLNPNSSELLQFEGGEFRPFFAEKISLPSFSKSVDWYGGMRDHLGFAIISQGLQVGQENFPESEEI